MGSSPGESVFGVTRDSCRQERTARLVRRLLAEAAAAVTAPGAALWVVSDDGLRMLGAVSDGPASDVLENVAVPVADSVIGMVATNGLATSIGPEDYHNPSVDDLTGLQTRSMIAAPVYRAHRLIGVISAINPAHGGLFSADDLERLSWKAYLIGLVLADCHGA
jgi:hypothetical protein